MEHRSGQLPFLMELRPKLPADKILYDKGCDLVENKAIESYFPNCSLMAKKVLRLLTGIIVILKEMQYQHNKLQIRYYNQLQVSMNLHPGLTRINFPLNMKQSLNQPGMRPLFLRFGATGLFELLVNGESVKKYSNWRTVIAKTPFKVEKGKKYKIEIRLTQQNNWQANIEFNFGKEMDVDYSNLIKKLKGIDIVIFAGGLSTQLEGEEMP